MIYNTIIIGGGAAGLFAAANLKTSGTLVLESTNKLGKKILITGSGMCNITNMDQTEDFITRFGGKNKLNFLKPAILNLSTSTTRKWLEDKGLDLEIRDDGKVFPKSLKAQSLIDLLQKEAAKNNVQFKYNSKVKGIQIVNSNFKISTTDRNYSCKKLIIATGGKSFPQTGSDGSMFSLIQNLGHKITPLTPSLTGLKAKNYQLKSLAGTSVRGSFIEFFREGETKRYLLANSDILFTHKGLSGPGIINNSRFIRPGDEIQMSLISCMNKEISREDLLKTLTTSDKKSIKRVLKEIGLTNACIEILLTTLKIKPDEIAKQLSKKERNKLITNLLSYKIIVNEKIGYNGAMATSGGVDISEVNRKTMESKLIPNLYFAGEVLDIDGDTGGYNIQAAFSTAKLCTDAVNR